MVGADPSFLTREQGSDARAAFGAVRWLGVFSVLVPPSFVLAQCGNAPSAGLIAANTQASGDSFDDRFPAPQFKDRFPTASESFVQRQAPEAIRTRSAA